VLSQEIGSALADAMARLPEPMRETFSLCAVSGFTLNEAAVVLGLTRAAAKTRLFRVHIRMRASLRRLWQAHRSVAAD
jgi:DNA-directed RNA polymerase specialized sigma24 family protein